MGNGTGANALRVAALVAAAAVTLCASGADVPTDADCLLCHSDKTLARTNAAGSAVSLYVNAAQLAVSAHRTNTCASCHSDISAVHPEDNRPARPVACAVCHAQQTDSYGASVHGIAATNGAAGAPACQDCHGSHDVLPPASAASPLHFTRQSATCGACHVQEAQDVDASVHGRATAAGKREAPACTDCHSEHGIRALSRAPGLRISEEICSQCHASERLNTKYNLPADRVKTFFESYHGLASQYGSTLAANCGSCHGYHRILPSSDPQSTIHPDHLVQTCGKCHPGASENFALSKIHVDITAAQSAPDISSRINWWVRRIYLVLIFGVVGAMFVHNALLFYRKVAAHLRASGRHIMRMSLGQRWQHAVLAVSFVALAVTGFALKFPDSWVASALGSSEPLRRWAHRIAGLVLLVVGVYHVVYLFSTKDGRKLFRDLFPARKDAGDVWRAAGYLAGWRPQKPRIGRFGYAEKMEYWAVIWGTIIMGVTGLMIWFKMDVTRFLPRWLVDVAVTIHYYEAVLACLAIVVWHFYHVIFDPDVYPLNLACWDGRVSRHWQEEEHPLEEISREDGGPAASNGTTPATPASAESKT